MPHENPPPPSRDAPEDAAFDRLVAEHQQRIYFFIRSMVFNPDDARDTLQDVNIVLYRKKDAYEHGTNFKAWAFTIARFECLSYLSRYKKQQWTTLDTGLLESLADKAEEKSDDVEPWLDALRHCIQLLPQDVQQLVDSRYQQRTPLDTTAIHMQTSVGALKQKLFRARKQLKQCILQRVRRGKNPPI
ncbi:MAG: sigma-70 family RNA polymerase sigma factor [Akkermansiaceae bacterium]|nr:sigma-70 family RNA polymerase sigma factor [Akkermansiaceae bacterium]